MKKLLYTFLAVSIIFSACEEDDDSAALTTLNTGTSDCQFSGNWSGTYTGAESATIDVVISANCTVNIDVDNGDPMTDADASVTNSGDFSAFVYQAGGSSDSGKDFEGQLIGNSGSGTWASVAVEENPTWIGTWQISKQ